MVAPADLIVLTADANTEFGLHGIFQRHASLGTRCFTFEIRRHPERDPGCLRGAHDFLRPFAQMFRHALVVFDREGCGQDAKTRADLERQVEEALDRTWPERRAAAIVIDPELENWVWSESPHLEEVLGWSGRKPDLRSWLEQTYGVVQDTSKPRRPKEALETALREVRIPRSSAIYRELADKVSLKQCRDPAFEKLKTTLVRWFPATRRA